ncbi:MAG: glycosyltransferase family 4 protein, partial [Solirubrobacteraceae bacterium]
IVTPSHATAADVRAVWGLEAVVAPHGPGQAPEPARGAPRHFLYVGDAEPRKNLRRLLAAYAAYRETTATPLDLVLAGRAGVPPAPGVRVDPAPRLAELHRHAAALVLPSLHEGFGLPALEAMHAGTPVLAADVAALREVCAGAARYADPYDVGALTAGLTELATVPPLREELRRRGVTRAAAFSWERCARAHVVAYEAAIARTVGSKRR